VTGQSPICWDTDCDAAVSRAHDQFRWFGGGGHLNATLPSTARSEGRDSVLPSQMSRKAISCGPDLNAIVDAVRAHWEAGFTDIAPVGIGEEGQDQFLKKAAAALLQTLTTAADGMRAQII
jgi:hypothetical protein